MLFPMKGRTITSKNQITSLGCITQMWTMVQEMVIKEAKVVYHWAVDLMTLMTRAMMTAEMNPLCISTRSKQLRQSTLICTTTYLLTLQAGFSQTGSKSETD